MADMTITIEAIDKATKEIAAVKNSVASMERSMKSAAAGTAAATRQTTESMGKLGAAVRALPQDIGLMMTAWRSAMKILGASPELSGVISAIHTLGGEMASGLMRSVGLGDFLRGAPIVAQLEVLRNQLRDAEARSERLQTAGPSRVDPAIRAAEIEAAHAAIAALRDQISIAERAFRTGFSIEEQTKIVQGARSEGEAQGKITAERNAQLAAMKEISRLAAAQERPGEWDFGAGPGGRGQRSTADLRPIQSEIQKLIALRDSIGAGGFAGLGQEAAWNTINERIEELNASSGAATLKTKMLALEFTAAQADALGWANAIEQANKELAELDAAPIKEAAAAIAEASPKTETLGTHIATTAERLRDLQAVADAMGGQTLPSLRAAIDELKIREAAEDWAAWSIGFDATEEQIAAIAAAMRDMQPVVEHVQSSVESYALTLQDVAQSVSSNFADAFLGMINGTMSVSEAFTRMVQSITSDLLRLVIQRQLMSLIVGLGGGSAIGATTATPAPTWFGGATAQHGGTVRAGAPVLVGERGPELFVPHQSGYVNSNGTMGGGTHITFAISAVDGPSVRAMLAREKDTIKSMISSAVQNDSRFRASLN